MLDTNEGKTILFHDRRVRGTIILVLLLLSTFLFVKTISEIKEYRYIGGGVPAHNTITVQGTGEVFAVADTAEFSFSIIEEDSTVDVAQEAAAEKINTILEYLEDQDVDEKDIKTTNYSVYPRYEYTRIVCVTSPCPPSGERTLRGFEVNQSILVKVRDTDEAGKILSAVGELGATNISGLNFTIDDEEGLKKEARSEAIDNARDKAKELSKDLGIRLVRVVSFSESRGDVYPRYAFDDAIAEASFGIGGGTSPDIPVGENKITSFVSITYEIR